MLVWSAVTDRQHLGKLIPCPRREVPARAPCDVRRPTCPNLFLQTQRSRPRTRMGSRDRVVAWVMACAAARPHCMWLRPTLLITSLCLSVCPDACPAAGDHAHFICFCVPSVRLPVWHCSRLGCFGLHYLCDCHSLLRCAFYQTSCTYLTHRSQSTVITQNYTNTYRRTRGTHRRRTCPRTPHVVVVVVAADTYLCTLQIQTLLMTRNAYHKDDFKTASSNYQ